MTLFFVGEIVSGDIIQRTDKHTGQITEYLTVNVMMRMVTKQGKPKIYAEDITLPMDYKELIDRSVGKYIVIPYQYFTTKDKAFLFVDEKYQVIILDKNPFEPTAQSKKAA